MRLAVVLVIVGIVVASNGCGLSPAPSSVNVLDASLMTRTFDFVSVPSLQRGDPFRPYQTRRDEMIEVYVEIEEEGQGAVERLHTRAFSPSLEVSAFPLPISKPRCSLGIGPISLGRTPLLRC
jgi:hypothetical protein